jgi:WD40 repeat protein
MEGHARVVLGVQVLADGRLLSWSFDGTLRLWDGQTGACLAVLEGHADAVWGVQVLADGRLLSWSDDETLRLWDGQSGVCLAVMEGHAEVVSGVQVLADGRLLSWSNDRTLRLWDSQSGACLAVFEGHADAVRGVQVLADGRLLSWSEDTAMRLGEVRSWDTQSGACLDVVSQEQAHRRYPQCYHLMAKTRYPQRVIEDFSVRELPRTAELRHKTLSPPLAAWNADSVLWSPYLLPDGTAIVGQPNGQVCILKLHHGQRRISLAEAEAMLPQLSDDH